MPIQTNTVVHTVWSQCLEMHAEPCGGTRESLGLPAARVTSERCMLWDWMLEFQAQLRGGGGWASVWNSVRTFSVWHSDVLRGDLHKEEILLGSSFHLPMGPSLWLPSSRWLLILLEAPEINQTVHKEQGQQMWSFPAVPSPSLRNALASEQTLKFIPSSVFQADFDLGPD